MEQLGRLRCHDHNREYAVALSICCMADLVWDVQRAFTPSTSRSSSSDFFQPHPVSNHDADRFMSLRNLPACAKPSRSNSGPGESSLQENNATPETNEA